VLANLFYPTPSTKYPKPMASKKPRVKIQCTVCKNINYFTKKSKGLALTEKKLEMSKFCNHCKKHTPHKEGRK